MGAAAVYSCRMARTIRGATSQAAQPRPRPQRVVDRLREIARFALAAAGRGNAATGAAHAAVAAARGRLHPQLPPRARRVRHGAERIAAHLGLGPKAGRAAALCGGVALAVAVARVALERESLAEDVLARQKQDEAEDDIDQSQQDMELQIQQQ